MKHIHFTAYDLDSRPRGNRSAGVVLFAPETVRLERTAGGASLSFGYAVHLNPDLCVSISNVTGEVSFQGKQAVCHRARDRGRSGKPRRELGLQVWVADEGAQAFQDRQMVLRFRGLHHALERIDAAQHYHGVFAAQVLEPF